MTRNDYMFLSKIYDLEMEEVINYDRWASVIDKWIRIYRPKAKLLVDLACGTGNISWRLFDMGYDLVASDRSEDMLTVARAKRQARGPNFIKQDMRKVDLPFKADVFVSTCDSINYIRPRDLSKVFKSVGRNIEVGGIFIFDINTEYKYSNIIGSRVISEVQDDYCYIWDNHYNSKKKHNEYKISFFIRQESNIYLRGDECHIEYVHENESILYELNQAGFEFIRASDDYTDGEIKKDSQRIVYIAKKL